MTQAAGPAGQALARLAAATAGLVAGLDGLGEAEARAASRLPGWTRGHVLTHLARNAEGAPGCWPGPGPGSRAMSTRA